MSDNVEQPPASPAAPDPVIQMTGRLDPRENWTVVNCPIAKTFDELNTKTAYLLLREAFYGASRFEEFVERAGISEPVAASRLRELVNAGMLEKFPYREPGQRTRNGYRLTEKGSAFLPVLVAMMDWGNHWLYPQGGRVELTHRDCGRRINAQIQCEAGHAVSADELDLTPRTPTTA